MAELVNLRQRRKQRAREEKEQKARQNRILYGLPTRERIRQQIDDARALEKLEGHRLTKKTGDTPPQ